MPPPAIPPEAPEEICRSLGAKLIQRLGAGAAKQTYHIELPDQGSLALKILDGAFPKDRLEREIEAMRSCNHANIARLHSLKTTKVGAVAVTYILEEYLDGGSLAERLKTSGPLSTGETRALMRTLSVAISHLQERHLVHRDIKPDNIMFRRVSDEPVLVDFGIVRDLSKDSLTQSFVAMGPGTPYFAAPEQLHNDKYQIDWRTDQFSLGVVGSICALESHPYAHADDSQLATVQRVALRVGPRPSFSDEAAAAGLSELIKMVAPWSVRRFRLPVDLIGAWRR